MTIQFQNFITTNFWLNNMKSEERGYEIMKHIRFSLTILLIGDLLGVVSHGLIAKRGSTLVLKNRTNYYNFNHNKNTEIKI